MLIKSIRIIPERLRSRNCRPISAAASRLILRKVSSIFFFPVYFPLFTSMDTKASVCWITRNPPLFSHTFLSGSHPVQFPRDTAYKAEEVCPDKTKLLFKLRADLFQISQDHFSDFRHIGNDLIQVTTIRISHSRHIKWFCLQYKTETGTVPSLNYGFMVAALQPLQFLQDLFFGSVCGIGPDNDTEFLIRTLCFLFQPSAEAMAIFQYQLGRQTKLFIACSENKISSRKFRLDVSAGSFPSLHPCSPVPGAHLQAAMVRFLFFLRKNSSLCLRKRIVASLSRLDLHKSRLDIGCDIFDLSGVYISKNGFS